MASGDDRAIENLIHGSEKLIQELVDTGIPEADALRLAADIEANIQRGRWPPSTPWTRCPSEAGVEVSVSRDSMTRDRDPAPSLPQSPPPGPR